MSYTRALAGRLGAYDHRPALRLGLARVPCAHHACSSSEERAIHMIGRRWQKNTNFAEPWCPCIWLASRTSAVANMRGEHANPTPCQPSRDHAVGSVQVDLRQPRNSSVSKRYTSSTYIKRVPLVPTPLSPRRLATPGGRFVRNASNTFTREITSIFLRQCSSQTSPQSLSTDDVLLVK